MGNLLFSPNGRIGPDEFMRGLFIIAAISAVISIVPLINFALGSMLSLVAIVLLYPLFCLLIKRSHDGGKSGWMSIVWFLIFVVVQMILGHVVTMLFGGDITAEMETATQAAAESGDPMAVFNVITEYAPQLARKTAIPSAIAGFVSTMASGYIVNMIVKKEPTDNQYGPA